MHIFIPQQSEVIVLLTIRKGAGSRGNTAKLLLRKAGKVEGLVVSDVELSKLMKDRDEWRLRVSDIVIANN